jgi:hypothetical protein
MSIFVLKFCGQAITNISLITHRVCRPTGADTSALRPNGNNDAREEMKTREADEEFFL